ncbi:LysR family transcriptional regulator [Streptomyces shenzhenensis]|uniref:LysR family transcriptional regulator n=1 Tax=Streptomyces shenzhenensis TaxID=943815 RepID=UPI001F395AFF|nr:LysR family transcriptional regulator [Streptomyces shenzhenensis]
MDISLSQMAVIDAVARHRSFSRAARELHIGQPVVSRTVALVERVLNATLFTRTTRAVELTDAGHAYLTVARAVLAAAERGQRQWNGYLTGENGEVAIAALPSVAATVLPAAVRGFTRGHPGRSVTVFDMPAAEGVTMLETGKADLAVCDAEEASRLTGPYDVEVLATDSLVAVMPPDSRLTALREVTWAELSREPFVALQPGTGVRVLTDFGFASAGTPPRALVTARGVATVAGLVAAGIGVSAMPQAVLPLLGFQEVTVRPLTEPAVTRQICLLGRNPLPPAAQAFRRAVAEAFAQRPSPVDLGLTRTDGTRTINPAPAQTKGSPGPRPDDPSPRSS